MVNRPPWHGSMALYLDVKAGRVELAEFQRRHAAIRERVNHYIAHAGRTLEGMPPDPGKAQHKPGPGGTVIMTPPAATLPPASDGPAEMHGPAAAVG